MVVDVAGLQATSLVKWPTVVLDPIKIFGRLKSQPRNIHRVAWELLITAGEIKKATVVMDKS
jgi:hypothetical protein